MAVLRDQIKAILDFRTPNPASDFFALIDSYQLSAAESAAGVTPSNFTYRELDPLRYGAVGDGVTDDSAAMNRWAAVMNMATAPNSVWTGGKIFLCSPITTITVNDATLQMNGGTIKVKANSTGIHVNFTGVRTRIYAGTIDGNQAAFSGTQTAFLLVVGNDFLLVGVTLKNSVLIGMQLASAVQGTALACHFDSNAACGMQLNTCSYLRFLGCTFNFNGYGFQGSYSINGPGTGQFSVAIRFRSHHLYFNSCEAQKSGSDGINVNQGSYAIKFVQCLVWENNDGGFTIASDVTGGSPGDGEACYDLEYVDCEGYNNFSGGIAAYNPCYNVTVEGGRYYNNGRVLGTVAIQTSFLGGIYITGGSQGLWVRAKCYDDRQICPITAVSGTSPRVLTATGWISGTSSNYPRVALYNASMTFQGYGTISSESAGSVSITTTANNGVTLASIAAGWFVSQRVQANGCLFDNGCQGSMSIDGFGHLPGVFGYTGFKSLSGYLSSGQNVLLPDAPLDYTELLLNPTWDTTTGSGTSWNYTLPAGSAAALFTTAGPLLKSPGCIQMTGGTVAQASADSVLITSGLAYAQVCWIEASCWVYATNSGDAAITLFYNTGSLFSTTVTHSGGGWKQLKIGIFTAVALTQLTLRIASAPTKTCYFDTASIRAKSDAYDNRDFSWPTRNLPL